MYSFFFYKSYLCTVRNIPNAPAFIQFDWCFIGFNYFGWQSSRNAFIHSPILQLAILIAHDSFNRVAALIDVLQYGCSQNGFVFLNLCSELGYFDFLQFVPNWFGFHQNLAVIEFL